MRKRGAEAKQNERFSAATNHPGVAPSQCLHANFAPGNRLLPRDLKPIAIRHFVKMCIYVSQSNNNDSTRVENDTTLFLILKKHNTLKRKSQKKEPPNHY